MKNNNLNQEKRYRVSKRLINAREIEKWARENGRKPRKGIKGVKATKKREEETPEQRELRLGRALTGIESKILKKYEGISLEEIEDENNREVVKIIRELDKRYRGNRENPTRRINKNLINAREIEEWARENERKPRHAIIGIKTIKKREEETPEQRELRLGHALSAMKNNILKKYEGINLEEIEDIQDREIVEIIRRLDEKYPNIYLINAREIEKWARENRRKPRMGIKGVKATKKREEETPEQRELRLGRALTGIKTNILKKYEGISLEEIEDKSDREIVKIIRELDKTYRDNIRYNEGVKKILIKVREIEEWARENGRKPRMKIRGVQTTKKREEETPEQRELRLGHTLNAIKTKILKKYEGTNLEEIEDEEDREIVRIIRRLDEEPPNIYLINAREIEKWARENERKPRMKIRGVQTTKKREEETLEQRELRIGRALTAIKTNILKRYEGKSLEEIEDEEDRKVVEIIRKLDEEYPNMYLINAREIEEWTRENGRKPRCTIIGVKTTKKREEETLEQRELRIGRALTAIKTNILKRYEGKSLEEIEDENNREVVKIIRGLDNIYGDNRKRKVDLTKVSKDKLAEQILTLAKTKNATEEQLKIIADCYGVELKDIEVSQGQERVPVEHDEH